MMKANWTRVDARKGVLNNRPNVMRDQAGDYLRLAAMTQLPALAEVFRAKAHALYAQATLIERTTGRPDYSTLA
jgi:hypothetical protein